MVKIHENMIRMGADPEFFAIKKGQKLATSAHLLEVRRNAGDTFAGALLKRDGFAVEINPNASVCRDTLRQSISSAVLGFSASNGKEYKLSAVPVQRLNTTSLNSNAPDDVMGYACVPDINAYEMEEKSPPTTGYHSTSRYTGGHLHMSVSVDDPSTPRHYKSNSPISKAAHAIMADLWLSIPLVAMIGEVNDYGEAKRRQYYGQAGSYRETSYGYEYRVPSSVIFMSPALMCWAMGQLRRGQILFGKYERDEWNSYVRSSTTPDNEWVTLIESWDKEFGHDTIQRIINEHDVDAARKFVEVNKKFYAKMYYKRYYDLMLKADAADIAMNTDMRQVWKTTQGCEYVLSAKFAKRPDAHLILPQVELLKKGSWGNVVEKTELHEF